MRIPVPILGLLIFCQSCIQSNDSNKQDFEVLQYCDEVTIIYYNRNDTLTYNAKDTPELAILTKLIAGRQDQIGDSCKPTGQLIYKSKGKTVFNAEFSTSDSNEEFDCTYVVYQPGEKTYKHRLTYQAGRLIDETLWTIKSSTLKINMDSIRLYKDTTKARSENNR